MRRIAIPALLLLTASHAAACTFCSGGLRSRPTLREQFRDAPIVVQGQLKNPRFNPDGVGGSTELHVDHHLKTTPAFGTPKVVVLPRYIPVIGDTPPDFLVFGEVANGTFDVTFGTPATAAVIGYLNGFTKLPPDNPTRRLGYCFGHLDSADPAIAADAFLELGKATDAELVAARAVFDPAKLRSWLTDPNTPTDRLGVYAMLLGVSGKPTDAAVFARLLAQSPRPEPVSANLGGLLAGYALLDPNVGWELTASLLADGKRPISERIAAIGTVRFFQATRPADAKPAVLRCYRGVIRQAELADLAIEDLRRWGWWELTPDALAAFSAGGKPPPIVRRGVVRYALTCPLPAVKAFVANVRASEPELVACVEESLAVYEAVPAGK